MKKRILFVDDEKKILKGIERALDDMQNEWHIEFAASGKEALDILGSKTFDIVITDMRMPGMDGDQLLSEVKERFPRIIRIVLTGTTERDMVLKLVKTGHQYIAKPCNFETLKSKIDSIFTLRDVLESNELREIICGMQIIPSIPEIHTQLIEELESPNASLKNIVKIISQDVGITTKILHLVNSPYFGISRYISSQEEAIKLLGLEVVKALTITAKVFAKYDGTSLPGFSIKKLYGHCISTAGMAKVIAEKEEQEEAVITHSFIAGMLHDLGKLVLAVNFPEKYKKVIDLLESEEIELWQAEKEVFGNTHTEVGAYLMSIWGMTNPIIEAIAFHHCPEKCPHDTFSPLTAVYAGNILENDKNSNGKKEAKRKISLNYLSRLGLADKPAQWAKACKETMKEGSNNE
jgi:HD-like signal output (HDOD) protein/ActR/RegA family two-component response regulator